MQNILIFENTMCVNIVWKKSNTADQKLRTTVFVENLQKIFWNKLCSTISILIILKVFFELMHEAGFCLGGSFVHQLISIVH